MKSFTGCSAAIVAALFLTFAATASEPRDPNAPTHTAEGRDQTLEELLAGLERRERAIPDLGVTLECVQQSRAFDSDKLVSDWRFTLLVISKSDGRLWWDATGRKSLSGDGSVHMQPQHKRLAYDGTDARTLRFDASGNPVGGDIESNVVSLGFDIRQLFRYVQTGQPWSEYLNERGPQIVGEETREGSNLVVVETTPTTLDSGEQLKDRLLIAPDWGYAVAERVQLLKPSGGEDWSRISSISMVGFRSIADIWLPARMVQTLGEHKDREHPVLRIDATAQTWHVGIDVPDRQFRLEFPPNIQVRDGRSSPVTAFTTPPLASGLEAEIVAPREPIYDENMDLEAAVQRALGEARVDQKRVLLMFGGNWCGPCYQLHDTMKGDEAISRLLEEAYEVLYVDVALLDQNDHLAERFEHERIEKHGVPFLMILDVEGQVIATQRAQMLTRQYGTGFSTTEIWHFLEKWSAEVRD